MAIASPQSRAQKKIDWQRAMFWLDNFWLALTFPFQMVGIALGRNGDPGITWRISMFVLGTIFIACLAACPVAYFYYNWSAAWSLAFLAPQMFVVAAFSAFIGAVAYFSEPKVDDYE